MSFLIKALTAIGGSGTVFSITYSVFNSMIPKSIGGLLLWEGTKLTKDQNLFRGVYLDYQEEIKNDLDLKSAELEGGVTELMSWCEDKFNETIKDEIDSSLKTKLDKYCLGKITTVRGYLGSLNITNWIGNVEDTTTQNQYKYLFALYKKNPNFKSWVGAIDTDKPSTGYSKIKNKCKEELDKSIKDFNKNTAQYLIWWCTKVTPLTIKQRAKENNSSWAKPTQESEWANNFNKWKYTSQFLTFFKNVNYKFKGITQNSRGENNHESIKTWCETGLSKNIYEDDVYDTEYQRYVSACKKQS